MAVFATGVRIQCIESLRYQSRVIVEITPIKNRYCEKCSDEANPSGSTIMQILHTQEGSKPTGDHFTPPSFVMTLLARH